MPTLTRLAADVDRMRRGLVTPRRRQELQALLAGVDPALRHQRNIERLKLANLTARLRSLDSRQNPSTLQAAAEHSERRLAVLERRLLEAMAAIGK